MSDTVDTITVHQSRSFHVVRVTNASDGTGEGTPVKKIDISTLVDQKTLAPLALDILELQWSIGGFNYVTLAWDADTDDEIAVISGNGFRDYRPYGPLKDPLSAGNVGDVMVGTDGAVDGAHYDILIVCALRQN